MQRSNMKLLLVLLSILFALGEGEALQCWRCDIRSGGRSIADEPNLDQLDHPRYNPLSTSTEECPEGDDYVCGHMKVQMSKLVQRGIPGSRNPYDNWSETIVNIKGCMHKRPYYNGVGSTTNERYIREELIESQGFTESELRGMTVRGKVCYCGTYLCNTKCVVNNQIVKDVVPPVLEEPIPHFRGIAAAVLGVFSSILTVVSIANGPKFMCKWSIAAAVLGVLSSILSMSMWSIAAAILGCLSSILTFLSMSKWSTAAGILSIIVTVLSIANGPEL